MTHFHLHHAVYHHYTHAYAPAYHSSGAFGGIGHMIVSAIIHAAIWHAMAPLFRGLGAFQAILLAIVIIGGVWFVGKAMSRARA
jgi:hypothetical protein